MAVNVETERDLPVLEIRVLDMRRKSSFRVRHLTDFPVVNTMDKLRKVLKILLSDIEHVEKCQFGYVMERNKKFTTGMDNELEKAFEYFKAGYQMWLDPTPLTQSTKRTSLVGECNSQTSG